MSSCLRRPYHRRHCERSEAIHSFFLVAAMDCFAALAMTLMDLAVAGILAMTDAPATN